jgi:indole-3-glycerol phosphate synthase
LTCLAPPSSILVPLFDAKDFRPMAGDLKTGTLLDRIVEARRAAYQHRMKSLPLPVLKMAVRKNPGPRDFAGALAGDGVNVVAELKKASPSRGLLRESFDPAALAEQFAQAGAAALSVLTEEEFFQGGLDDLRKARKATELPVLRKDFILDEWQVWESRAGGADALLLIAAILDDGALGRLLVLARELGMEPLVEAHTREELRRALDAGARIIGVNNRDLRSFEVRLETSLELVGEIPDDCIAVAESGIRAPEDLARLRRAGFDAFLIGEHLMESPQPAAALRHLLSVNM